MNAFQQDQFDDYRESTIGAAFLTQTISLDDTTTVKFEIWDTAGQERYKSLAPMYYRNANCAVVVYDITQAVRLPSLHILRHLHQIFGNKSPLQETPLILRIPVLPRQSQILGKRTPAPSKRKHHHCSRRQQSRPRRLSTRQARHRYRRCRSLCPRIRSPVLRDQRKDGRERPRPVHSHRKEVATGSGGAKRTEGWSERSRCRFEARGTGNAGRGWLQLLSGSRLGWF